MRSNSWVECTVSFIHAPLEVMPSTLHTFLQGRKRKAAVQCSWSMWHTLFRTHFSLKPTVSLFSTAGMGKKEELHDSAWNAIGVPSMISTTYSSKGKHSYRKNGVQLNLLFNLQFILFVSSFHKPLACVPPGTLPNFLTLLFLMTSSQWINVYSHFSNPSCGFPLFHCLLIIWRIFFQPRSLILSLFTCKAVSDSPAWISGNNRRSIADCKIQMRPESSCNVLWLSSSSGYQLSSSHISPRRHSLGQTCPQGNLFT